MPFPPGLCDLLPSTFYGWFGLPTLPTVRYTYGNTRFVLLPVLRLVAFYLPRFTVCLPPYTLRLPTGSFISRAFSFTGLLLVLHSVLRLPVYVTPFC